MSRRDDDQHTDDQYRWHLRAIDAITGRWRDGTITLDAKRQAIEAENDRYYGDQPMTALEAAAWRAAHNGRQP